ncbi:hypothetical protein MSAN_01998200 [Mycena sanguinolenta]|uniref:Uncharacterized protein n=1 Tax=Mycena sanguinolenta TaxID=230812 RepID=A0A8H7CNV9_9AGAR|nr:hypothetical protein MSAN_01998200 [Mycena sanguinolenta]
MIYILILRLVHAALSLLPVDGLSASIPAPSPLGALSRLGAFSRVAAADVPCVPPSSTHRRAAPYQCHLPYRTAFSSAHSAGPLPRPQRLLILSLLLATPKAFSRATRVALIDEPMHPGAAVASDSRSSALAVLTRALHISGQRSGFPSVVHALPASGGPKARRLHFDRISLSILPGLALWIGPAVNGWSSYGRWLRIWRILASLLPPAVTERSWACAATLSTSRGYLVPVLFDGRRRRSLPLPCFLSHPPPSAPRLCLPKAMSSSHRRRSLTPSVSASDTSTTSCDLAEFVSPDGGSSSSLSSLHLGTSIADLDCTPCRAPDGDLRRRTSSPHLRRHRPSSICTSPSTRPSDCRGRQMRSRLCAAQGLCGWGAVHHALLVVDPYIAQYSTPGLSGSGGIVRSRLGNGVPSAPGCRRRGCEHEC